MSVDLTEIFKKYEALTKDVNALFEQVKGLCGDMVACEPGCSDCCHALFDVSLVEALYLNHHFKALHPEGASRDRIVAQADEADRSHYKLKRKAFKATEKGVPTTQILADLAKERIRCPLLNDEDRCDLYEFRPVTCRLYGLPLDIGGQGHSCGRSGFAPGGEYPTVKIEKLQDRLMLLARELVESIPTKYPGLGDMLVPVSMAILTEYDDEYLGLTSPEEAAAAKAPAQNPQGGDACASCDEGPLSDACKSCKSGVDGEHSWIIPGPDPDKRDEGEE